MWMTVGERRFAVTLADNAAARAFAAQLPLTLDMSELNGNEKHADLPKTLPRMRADRERSAMATLCCTAQTPWLSFIRRSTRRARTRPSVVLQRVCERYGLAVVEGRSSRTW